MLHPNKKFRLLKHTKRNGKVFYTAQYRVLWWYENFGEIETSKAIRFDTRKQAMERLIQKVLVYLHFEKRMKDQQVVKTEKEDVTDTVVTTAKAKFAEEVSREIEI